MSQSLSKIFVHAVWHIKTTSPQIQMEDRKNLYSYMGGILKQLECIPICINGTGNHVHMLFVLSKNYSLVKVMSTVKIASSRWLKTIGKHYKSFAWQLGYGAFSVSESIRERTINYIKNQEEHHKKRSFKDEYLQILKQYHIDFDIDYLLRD
jgi:REP element-mobilizing transposase RayT